LVNEQAPRIACVHLPALCPSRIHVGELSDLEARTHALLGLLGGFSPRVERAAADTFYLDPNGLERLFGELPAWAQAVHAALVASSAGAGRASLVVGFGRHRTRALATHVLGDRWFVVPDPAFEQAHTHALPLTAFGASEELASELAKLGVGDVATLLRLPALELGLRYGSEALALYSRAGEASGVPLSATPIEATIEEQLELDPPHADTERLLFSLKRILDAALVRLHGREQALARLELALQLETKAIHHETLEPARPTLDVALLLELLRLRLGAQRFDTDITQLHLSVEGVRVSAEQRALFSARPVRDPEAAARGLARVRALFGPASVARAQLVDGHLPEARFRYVETTSLRAPKPIDATPDATPDAPLVHRLLARPRRLGSREALATLGVTRLHGPHRIEGGWWAKPLRRDYYYAQTRRDELLLVFHDARRDLWFLHGEVD
jgi:protein ImuB